MSVHLAQHALISRGAVAGQLCKALACLTDEHSAVQQACSSAIAPMVALLSHSDTPVVDQACQALACLVSDCPQHQIAAAQAEATQILIPYSNQFKSCICCWRCWLLPLRFAALALHACLCYNAMSSHDHDRQEICHAWFAVHVMLLQLDEVKPQHQPVCPANLTHQTVCIICLCTASSDMLLYGHNHSRVVTCMQMFVCH